VAVLYTLPLIHFKKFKSSRFNFLGKKLFWILLAVVLLLTWAGARPVEDPYVIVSQILTLIYFSLFVVWPLSAS
jgi:ubiquinol-cytochrome c reductase cytochrome b subunit